MHSCLALLPSPQPRESEHINYEGQTSYSLAMHPRFVYAIELALSPSRGNFLSREKKLDGGLGQGGIARSMMSQVTLSLGKLIHQAVTSDSMQGHYRERQHASVWPSEVLVCSGAGGVKLINFISKAQMACCQTRAPAQRQRLRNNDSAARCPHCKT